YYRLAPPEVTLPALRSRLDEIPRHIASVVSDAAPDLVPHARFVEACLLRAWPGNVRELRKEIHFAAMRAVAEKSDRLRVEHLSPTAGCTLAEPVAPPDAVAPAPRAPGVARPQPESGPRRRSYVRWKLQI